MLKFEEFDNLPRKGKYHETPQKCDTSIFIQALELSNFHLLDEAAQTRALLNAFKFLTFVLEEQVLSNPRLKYTIIKFVKSLIHQTMGLNSISNSLTKSPNSSCRWKKASPFYYKTVHLLALRLLAKIVNYNFIPWVIILDHLIQILKHHDSKLVKSKVLQIATKLIKNKFVQISKMDIFINCSINLINTTRNSFVFFNAINFLSQLFLTINHTPSDSSAKFDFNFRNQNKIFEEITNKYIFLKNEEIFLNLLRNYLKNNDSTILCCVLQAILNILTLKRHEIDFYFYLKCCDLLENESEEVRLITIDLCGFISQYMGKM